MARTPRGTSVPKTTGQGISRGIYQTDYTLKGGAIGGGVKKAKVPKGTDSERNRYAKKGKEGDDFNVEYGGMFQPEDVKELGDAKPSAGWKDERKSSKGLK